MLNATWRLAYASIPTPRGALDYRQGIAAAGEALDHVAQEIGRPMGPAIRRPPAAAEVSARRG
ncbi:hypothetical protein MTX20_27895 [Bradyrhizobium sp. ISRA435]|nr:hypothetical protein MTX20_27895 [Bradyrhizobium sp. ISRA435]